MSFAYAEKPLSNEIESTMISEAESLYRRAIELREEGNPYDAIRLLSKVIVHHATNENFIAKSELLSAELYIDLDLLSAADATAEQIMNIYINSDIANEAAFLRERIKQLRLEAERIEDEE
jgi:outer membrane protein assembly factor BamD (BamD/ComL family)